MRAHGACRIGPTAAKGRTKVSATLSSFTHDRLWPKPMETLRVALADWTDFDASAHALAQCLGIMPLHQKMIEEKWVYWSENPLGTMLYSTLERLVELSVLEKREEPDLQYRWCSTYRVANERASGP
jgi:hypothetical protein